VLKGRRARKGGHATERVQLVERGAEGGEREGCEDSAGTLQQQQQQQQQSEQCHTVHTHCSPESGVGGKARRGFCGEDGDRWRSKGRMYRQWKNAATYTL
jgi:hypothetical protein